MHNTNWLAKNYMYLQHLSQILLQMYSFKGKNL